MFVVYELIQDGGISVLQLLQAFIGVGYWV